MLRHLLHSAAAQQQLASRSLRSKSSVVQKQILQTSKPLVSTFSANGALEHGLNIRSTFFQAQQQRLFSAASAAANNPIVVSSEEEVAKMYNAAELCQAASNGDLEAIQAMCAKGYDVNSRDYDGRTALHLAAAGGHANIIQFLLDNGAESTFDRFGTLPVDEAKRGHHYQAETAFTSKRELETRERMLAAVDKAGDNVPDPEAPSHVFDYTDAAFKSLEKRHCQQMELVFQMIERQGCYSYSLIADEVKHFYTELGLDRYYFDLFTAPQIAKHITSYMSSKHASLHPDSETGALVDGAIHISIDDDDSLFTCFTDSHRITAEENVEEFAAASKSGFHVTYFKSRNPAVEGGTQKLHMFYVERDNYENNEANDNDNVYYTATPYFLRSKKYRTIHRYQEMIEETMDKPYPIVKPHKPTHTFKLDVKIGHRVGRANDKLVLRQLSRTFDYLGIDFHKLHIDTFSNGVNIYSIYCDADLKDMERIENYATLALTIPDVPMYSDFLDGHISQRQLMYLFSASRFAYYFLRDGSDDYDFLHERLESNPEVQKKLLGFGKSLGVETFPLPRVYKFVQNNLDIGKALFIDFSRRLHTEREDYDYPDLEKMIATIRDPDEQRTMKAFLKFNRSVTTTNLWKGTKAAVSYRLDPEQFLGKHKLPELPFAIYMMLGMDFTGFHVRFRDISRGGVRLIKSKTQETYRNNRITQFQENYNLAYTQKLKNKDIPESGSKGTILMKHGSDAMAEHAFKQYVDSLMDLLMGEDGVCDTYGKPEYIFLGPDENTADYMDLACEYARVRGYDYWQSFTTGKSVKLGGVPHDAHGMTTRSVRAFVTGLQQRLGLKEEECTKVITGGPDGDLGSNEIMMGKEKIIGISDGSGCLYDPEGIDRNALVKLAKSRSTVKEFDGAFSSQGFFIDVDDKDITLPTGEKVVSGLQFRDTFHLWDRLEADFFVPCGGRPNAVRTDDVGKMFKADNTPRFKYIVEGANLFFTDGAREKLQRSQKVMLFKDASTNKGGVTSSSLEVLAGLSLDSRQFARHMQVSSSGARPAFYDQYVEDIKKIVGDNATNEFNYIVEQMEKTGAYSTDVTNELSGSMNQLNDAIGNSDLFDDLELRKSVLRDSLPESLVELVGLEQIMERIPPAYQKAIFSMHLSSKFFYAKQGGSDEQLRFYQFMKSYEQNL